MLSSTSDIGFYTISLNSVFRGPAVKKKISLSPIPLTEGNSELILDVEDGKVKKALLFALDPLRAFETMMLGKEFWIVPTLASRICGMCHAAHSIASARAIESAAKIEIPPNAKKLREVLLSATAVYSNLLHLIAVSQLIFSTDTDKKLRFVRFIQKIRHSVSAVLESIGGELVHPPNVRVGGMKEGVDEQTIDKLLKELSRSWDRVSELPEMFEEAIKRYWEEKGFSESTGKHDLPFLTVQDFVYEKLKLVMPQEMFKGNELLKKATNAFAIYDGSYVETGPRARFFKKGVKIKGGALELYILKVRETLEFYESIPKILKEVNPKEEFLNESSFEADPDRLGIGVVEAPRGVNVHAVRLKPNGKVMFYRVVVPTQFNVLAVSKAIEGEPVEAAEDILRAYDPCIACAVH